jgi:hypothetical protein
LHCAMVLLKAAASQRSEAVLTAGFPWLPY